MLLPLPPFCRPPADLLQQLLVQLPQLVIRGPAVPAGRGGARRRLRLPRRAQQRAGRAGCGAGRGGAGETQRSGLRAPAAAQGQESLSSKRGRARVAAALADPPWPRLLASRDKGPALGLDTSPTPLWSIAARQGCPWRQVAQARCRRNSGGAMRTQGQGDVQCICLGVTNHKKRWVGSDGRS